MSKNKDHSNTCGCCEGVKGLTPESVTNRPGLSAIAYRVGTHGSFKATMLAEISQHRALHGLSTRDGDDPSIALLDGWATVLDVLTFYQERIANEGYLRTAKERCSLLAMARHLSYELKPGVGASTYLIFTIEDSPGAFGEALGAGASSPTRVVQPPPVTIESGMKVQSVPGQDELPQVFETVEKIEARVEWNALKPRVSRPNQPGFGDNTLYLKGISSGLKKGDPLLVVGEEREDNSGNNNWDFRRVKSVETVSPPIPSSDPDDGYTVVTLNEGLGTKTPRIEPARKNPKVYALRQRAALFGYNAPEWRAMSKEFKDEYLGRPSLTSDTEWPDFTIAGLSDPPTGNGKGTGLYGEYFNSLEFRDLKLIRTDSVINFDWQGKSPHASLDSNTFSVRWSGWVETRSAGYYTFFTQSDDGVRLWVNGQKVIDQWDTHSSEEHSGKVLLGVAGQKYGIKLEYYEHGGNAVIQLRWQPPGGSKGIIPASHLYPRDIHTLHLDAVSPKIISQSWVTLAVPGHCELYEVIEASEDARANFSLSAKTTRLVLSGKNLKSSFNNKVRETAVYGQSNQLDMAEVPLTNPITGKEIVLNSLLEGMQKEHRLMLTGKRIRVKVVQRGSLISAEDATKTYTIQPGDEFIVKAPPVEVTGSSSKKYYLEAAVSRDGKNVLFTGYITIASKYITYIPAAVDDDEVSELLHLQELKAADANHTKLVLQASLQNIYDRTTVTISGNVAHATHGETVTEILGSGDGSKIFQKFILKQNPLTFISASTPSGAKTTLEIQVNDVLWQEIPSLYRASSDARVYITRIADDGKVTVQFGDGITGARLPTGQENVKAKYRKGIGLEGLVKKYKLSQLMSRPLGVKGVVNPLASAGGNDPEKLDMVRENAPLTVLTLDRIVSLQDYEDFARAFSGIGKAQAVMLQRGEERLVHLTVALSNGGGNVDESSDLFLKLLEAIDNVRHKDFLVRVAFYRPLSFDVEAAILVENDHDFDMVRAVVKNGLQEEFSFDKRAFGQAVTPSEVLAAIQRVKGVTAVDLNSLNGKDPFLEEHFRLSANIADWDEAQVNIEPAQLLTVSSEGINLTEMKEKK